MTDDDLKSLALDFRDQMVGIDLLRAVFQAGAASRDAEIADLTKQRDELLDVVKHLIDEAKLTSSQYELCRRAVNIHALPVYALGVGADAPRPKRKYTR